MAIAQELFPVQELSQTEQDLIVAAFDTPVVRKYLRALGSNLVRDYLMLDASAMSDEVLAKHHQFVKGQLALLDALCSIQAAS